MTMFWELVDRGVAFGDRGGRDEKSCKIVFDRRGEVLQEWPVAGRFAQEGLLSAKLVLTLEDFDLDYFRVGVSFASEKMRRAMALGPSDIQYFDVDASQSAPVPRSKNYKIMHVPVTEDVSDLKNSEYLCRHHPDGSLEIISPIAPAFRDDAHPSHEIFADRHFRQFYCTDEFALRILRANCSGAVFSHPSDHFPVYNRRFRTLRGIEEVVEADPSRNILRTKLIQEIPSKTNSAMT